MVNFWFQIHEQYLTVQYLAVHLKNSQRVYFTEERAAQPQITTLKVFFKIMSS